MLEGFDLQRLARAEASQAKTMRGIGGEKNKAMGVIESSGEKNRATGVPHATAFVSVRETRPNLDRWMRRRDMVRQNMYWCKHGVPIYRQCYPKGK